MTPKNKAKMSAAKPTYCLSYEYRSDIDGIRALAILSVVLFHAFPSILPGGFIGVDVFFVISGYLITMHLLQSIGDRSISLREFYFKRVTRIFPALILVIVVVYVIGWYVLLPSEFKVLGKHLVTSAAFSQNIALIREAGYFDGASDEKPLLHLWSLGIEEQFYLAWPLLICFMREKKQSILLLICGVVMGSFLYNLAEINRQQTIAFYSPFSRIWELMVGGFLSWWVIKKENTLGTRYSWIKYFGSLEISKRARMALLELLSVVGLLIIIYSVFEINSQMKFPGWWACLPVAGTFILIFSGPTCFVNRRILSNKLLVIIGLISYPLYLWHWPLLSLSNIIESGDVPIYIRIGCILVSFLLAYVTWRLIEIPAARHKISANLVKVLLVINLLILAVGILTFYFNGFPSRFSDLERMNSMVDGGRFSWLEENKRVDDVCANLYPEFKTEYCRISGNIAPSTVILGDSHAHHLFYGLNKYLGNNEGLLLLGIGGVPPFAKENTNIKQNNLDKSDKQEYLVPQMLDIALHQKGLSNIIVSFRGFVNMQGQVEAFKFGLENTLKRLDESGVHIVFVVDNPELPFSPKSCLNERPFRLTHSFRDECSFDQSSYLRQTEQYRLEVKRILDKFPRVDVVYPSDALCKNNICAGIIDKKIMYSDRDHLSVDGSILIAPLILQRMVR